MYALVYAFVYALCTDRSQNDHVYNICAPMNINARVFVTSANVRTYTHASGGTYAYVRTHVCICTYVLIRTSVRADAYVRTYTCRLRFGSYVVWGD